MNEGDVAIFDDTNLEKIADQVIDVAGQSTDVGDQRRSVYRRDLVLLIVFMTMSTRMATYASAIVRATRFVNTEIFIAR